MWPEKGEYYVTTQTVHVRCMGNCGKLFTLCDHTIADDGSVSPSVVCPNKNCDWHVYLKLLDWENAKEPLYRPMES